MKTIPLTQNKIALVDDDDYERLNQYKWCAARDKEIWYAVRKRCAADKKITVRMHREIMNTPKGVLTDHRNGNGLDNRKENLRICNHQQNQFNRISAQKNNILGIKGVRWDKKAKKFQARIAVNKKQTCIGLFTVLADADQAYRMAELKYFGEFARNISLKNG